MTGVVIEALQAAAQQVREDEAVEALRQDGPTFVHLRPRTEGEEAAR